MGIKKPKSITIQISDRKLKDFRSFVVYDMDIDDVEKKIKMILK